MNSVEIAGIVIAALLSSGALLFFIKYGTRLRLVETAFEDHIERTQPLIGEFQSLKSDILLIKNNMLGFGSAIEKLNTLAVINEKLDTLTLATKSTIPRPEMELIISSYERRIAALELELKGIELKMIRINKDS